jgi:hypothetical protein
MEEPPKISEINHAKAYMLSDSIYTKRQLKCQFVETESKLVSGYWVGGKSRDWLQNGQLGLIGMMETGFQRSLANWKS